MSKDLEVFKDIDTYFKIRIKDRTFPLKLIFKYDCPAKQKDLFISYS